MRQGIRHNCFVSKDDPFAVDIHYHKRCLDKYISNINTKKRREHVQGVTSKEVDAVFIDHVQRTVCQLNEPRTRFVKRLP